MSSNSFFRPIFQSPSKSACRRWIVSRSDARWWACHVSCSRASAIGRTADRVTDRWHHRQPTANESARHGREENWGDFWLIHVPPTLCRKDVYIWFLFLRFFPTQSTQRTNNTSFLRKRRFSLVLVTLKRFRLVKNQLNVCPSQLLVGNSGIISELRFVRLHVKHRCP